ncbi:MAG: hypothetical protein KatS3mg125_1423 [Lysobacterales bacterium]|nr:MAG: hypothetical protein KatS3mg125_1423 [Xanthomonadales bacterium]
MPVTVFLLVLLLSMVSDAHEERDPLAIVFPEARYGAAVPHPNQKLAHPLGSRAPTPEEIDHVMRMLADASPRLLYQKIGQSWQGRPLAVLFVSRPETLARLERLRAELMRLENPEGLSAAEEERLIKELPALAYLGYSIHGNETSGADAALLLAYHLAAAEDEESEKILASTLLILEPLMNPDGRARAVHDLRSLSGLGPSYDDQALFRMGSWPSGRFNHYGFDLNRDWIFATQPETRARIALLDAWRPHLFVDAHEMGAQDSFLFSPPREPVHPAYPPEQRRWVERFAEALARDFDRRGFVYYSGEWNEGWYPGYSDAWGGLRGAVNLLYEQARVADYGVLQANREILHYGEGIARQLAASWANLRFLAEHREALLRERVATRRRELRGPSDFWVLPSGPHPSREERLVELLERQGLTVWRNTEALEFAQASDALGRKERLKLPPGSLIVPAAQPLAPLLSALLDFDPKLSEAVLQEERRRLLRDGSSTVYDLTAWALPHFFGLPLRKVDAPLPVKLIPARRREDTPNALAETRLGWLIPSEDDASLKLASRLLAAHIRPRVALEAGELDGQSYPRGSLVVLLHDHRSRQPQWLRDRLAQALSGTGLPVHALASGRGPGDLPDLGGGRFRLLQPPRVAILGHGPRIQPDVFGFHWHYLEQELELKPTILAEPRLASLDLRRYNVLLLTDAQGELASDAEQALIAWVRAGNTLIATGASAARLARKGGPLSGARSLTEALEELSPFRDAVLREWNAASAADWRPETLWSHRLPEREATMALTASLPALSAEELRRLGERDRLARNFMPQGAFVAARCDERHWLSFGCKDLVPLLVRRDEPLLAAAPAEAPVRLGWFDRERAPRSERSDWRAFGWSGVPPASAAYLRIAGLLWPEAQERLLNSAWLLREPVGQGQVILFAGTPAFRGAALAMQRFLGNAVIFGPGLGTSVPILP